MKTEHLQKHSIWILTTLLSFSLRESLVRLGTVGPNDPSWPKDLSIFALQLHRFGVVLVTSTALLFGIVRYFEPKFVELEPQSRVNNSLAVDLFLAIFHLSFVFFLSRATNIHDANLLSSFLLLLWGVMLFDLVWLLISKGAQGSSLAREWTTLNVIVAITSFAFFSFSANIIPSDMRLASPLDEHFALLPVTIYRMYDMIVCITNRMPLRPLTRILDADGNGD